MSFKIIGTGSASPEYILTNQELIKMVDTSDEWIKSRSGISERRILTSETITMLGVKAALMALKKADISADSLDLIICTTFLGQYLSPSLACLIQRDIKAICPAFDMNVGCSGFIYALNVAKAYMDSNMARRILIVSAEQISKVTDYGDRATCVLFGDGAGAVVLEKGDNLLSIKIMAKGDDSILKIPHSLGCFPHCVQDKEKPYLVMNGQEVYKFAVNQVVEDIKAVSTMANIRPQDIDYLYLHQANLRIINAAQLKFGFSNNVMKHNIEKYGNTVTACIPMMLDESYDKGELNNKIIALAAFGAGLTSGACIIKV